MRIRVLALFLIELYEMGLLILYLFSVCLLDLWMTADFPSTVVGIVTTRRAVRREGIKHFCLFPQTQKSDNVIVPSLGKRRVMGQK